MNLQSIKMLLLLGGIALAVGGKVYPMMVNNDSAWSEENAIEFNEASRAYHKVAFAHAAAIGTDREAKLKAEYDAAEKRFDEAQGNLKWAQEGRYHYGNWMFWIGIALIGLAAVLIFTDRDQ